MKEAKKANQEAMMITPKLKGSGPSGKIGAENQMQDMTGN